MKSIVIAACMGVVSHTAWANQAWECHNMVAKEVCGMQSCAEVRNRNSNFQIQLKHKQVSICSHGNCWRGSATESLVNNAAIYRVPHFQWKNADRINHGAILVIQP